MYKVNMSVSYRHFKESTTRKNVEGGMALHTKGINRNVLKILILLIALQDNGMGAATPALQSISEAFPNAGYQLISMIVTLPALMLAIMPIFYPKLVQLFKKRWILIITAVLFLVGGVGPAFINSNIFIILLLRLLVGVACGIFMPLCIDLIVDFFEGNERAKMVGWSSTFTGFGGILFQTLGGYLASYHWSYCFFAYLVAVIFLLFPVIFLPEPMREKKLANRKVENQNITHQKVKTPFSVWITGFFLCLFWLFAYVIITNASTVLITEGIAAQSQVGLIFSFMTLGTVISSAFFGTLVAQRYGIDLTNYLGLHFFLASDFNPAQLITYMFMHGGFSHIFFNMFAVFMFGTVLERTWGPKRFLFYYIACGIGAGLIQEGVQYIKYIVDYSHYSQVDIGTGIIPMGEFLNMLTTVGASGAVYAILLAFGMLFPNNQLFIFPLPFPIKAKFFVFGYALIELYAGFANNPGDNVAHFAHLGGMIFGFILIMYWRKKSRNNGTYYN